MAFGHHEESPISDHEANLQVAAASLRGHLLGIINQIGPECQPTLGISLDDSVAGKENFLVNLYGVSHAITDALPPTYMGFDIEYQNFAIDAIEFKDEALR